MEKLNHIVAVLGKAEAARQLGLKSPMIITGWEKRQSIPDWRYGAVDFLYKKIKRKKINKAKEEE